MGLTICQRIVNQMGSEIKINSEEGKGAHFYFDLELKVEEVPFKKPSNRRPLRKPGPQASAQTVARRPHPDQQGAGLRRYQRKRDPR